MQHIICPSHLLSHVWAHTGSLQAVMEVGVTLDLDGEGAKVRLVHKHLSFQQTLSATVASEELHYWIVTAVESYAQCTWG